MIAISVAGALELLSELQFPVLMIGGRAGTPMDPIVPLWASCATSAAEYRLCAERIMDSPYSPMLVITSLTGDTPSKSTGITAAPTDERPRQPLLAACRDCQHVWPVLWLPCNMRLLARAVPDACPMCGTTRKADLCIASHTAGDFHRYAAWLAAELARARYDAGNPPGSIEGSAPP